MTIHEANKILNDNTAHRIQLLKCLEDLSKEYGYIQRTTFDRFSDSTSSRQTLVEMQTLIDQLKERLR